MKKTCTLMFLAILVLIPIWSAMAQDNMLANPGFEGDYHAQGDEGEIRVAEGWRAFGSDGQRSVPGIDGGFNDNPTRRPEWNAALPHVDPYRIRTGEAAQHWFSFSGTSYAGVFQRVDNVQEGNTYQASAWLHGWCDNEDGNEHYCAPNVAYVSIGIDPDGGDWYESRAIQWSQWQVLTSDYQEYNSPQVMASGERMTVYVSVAFRWAIRHNDAYLDDAVLIMVDFGGECPEPPPCPTPEPCAGSCEVDYARIEQIVEDVIARLVFGVVGGR